MVLKAVQAFIRRIRNVFKSNNTAYTRLKTGDWVKIVNEDTIQTVPENEVPENVQNKVESTGASQIDQVRRSTLSDKTSQKVAKKAVDNEYVFSDVMNDPDLVNAETPAEALEVVAETNPGWAKNVDIESINPNAEPDVETGHGTGQSGGNADSGIGSEGDSEGGAESVIPGVASGSIDTDAGEVDISTSSGGADSGSSSSGSSANTGSGSANAGTSANVSAGSSGNSGASSGTGGK